jgi:hypothetical protein
LDVLGQDPQTSHVFGARSTSYVGVPTLQVPNDPVDLEDWDVLLVSRTLQAFIRSRNDSSFKSFKSFKSWRKKKQKLQSGIGSRMAW